MADMKMKHNVPVQSLIDHIKTATDVDPWAKEMAEELLKKPEIIHCQDCKHWERRECGSYGTCENRDGFYDGDWFCADGERR